MGFLISYRHFQPSAFPALVGIGFFLCVITSGISAQKPDREEEEEAADRTSTLSASRLQQEVMDFSDRYTAALWQAFDEYIRNEPDVSKQVKAQRWKITLASASMTIAASRDPRANLLDMAVFISAGKWAVDHYWIPDLFGEKAAPLKAMYRRMDGEIWQEVDRVLTPAQKSDLRALIEEWKKSKPDKYAVANARLRNLEGVVLQNFEESPSAKGLLWNVRRLMGRVDQSLLYGERMMFYLERMSLLLGQQSDLTIDRVAERFPIATVNPDFARLSGIAESFSEQIGKSLESREGAVRILLPEIRASLESMERLTQSLEGTLASADSLAGRLQNLPLKREDYTQSIQQITHSLAEINGVVTGLNKLLESDTTSTGESRTLELMKSVDERSQQIVDRAFYRSLILLAVFFAGVILTLFVARRLFKKSGSQS